MEVVEYQHCKFTRSVALSVPAVLTDRPVSVADEPVTVNWEHCRTTNESLGPMFTPRGLSPEMATVCACDFAANSRIVARK